MNDSTAEFWNAGEANKFDQRTEESGRLTAIQRMVELAEPYIHHQDHVTIDLGCGTGLFAKLANNQNIIGVDFSTPLLKLASERMVTTCQESVFDFHKPDSTVNNIISLFVIDDYPNSQKISFFRKVFSLLTSQGHFFLATYSPLDERMGKLKSKINALIDNDFESYLESITYYKQKLRECGFEIEDAESVKTVGSYSQNSKTIELNREFDLIVAKKN